MDDPTDDTSDLLPSPDEAEGLLAHLAAVVAARGPGQLVRGLLVEPAGAHFPDRWEPSAWGVQRLARRLLRYAGLEALRVEINHEDEDEPPPGECALRERDLPVWFAGLVDGVCRLGVDEERLEDDEIVAASMCHAVAHAYRIHHRIAVPAVSNGRYRERPERLAGAEALEERLTDVTAVYLSFGVITANAAFQQRTTGRVQGSYVSWQMRTSRVGMLGPHAASYLLAAQVVVRGLDARERKQIARHLEANQAGFFEAACAALDEMGAKALRARLGIPPRADWPEAPDVETLTAPLPAEEAPAPRSKRRGNQGRPTFRVRAHQGVLGATLLSVTMLLLSAAITVGDAIVVTLSMAAGLVGGYALGHRLRRDECSDPMCETLLPIDATSCPRCGGLIVGEIKRRQDRLEALEAYEEKQGKKP